MLSWPRFKKVLRMPILCIVGVWVPIALGHGQVQAANPWDQSAASLAMQVADILGPGPVTFSIRNLSSIRADQVPSIRKSIEASLKARGVTVGGADSANAIRITISENIHEQILVAEIVEGKETKVAMVELGSTNSQADKASAAMALSRQTVLTTQDPILAALDLPAGLLVLQPESVVLYRRDNNVLKEQQRVLLNISRAPGRDPRGALLGLSNGSSFDAWLPGEHCSGDITSALEGGTLRIACSESDDPWAITQPPLDLVNSPSTTTSANVMVTPIRAFYNAARNSFTGILVPSIGSDLPPFYSLTVIPHASGFAILMDGIDGKVQLVESGASRTVAGTRDWGSDLAALHSGCGTGTQVVVSGSGDAVNDSLRAYNLPLLEAEPASEPLQLDGSVMGVNAAADGKSLLTIVHHANNQYEVDRVTALCN